MATPLIKRSKSPEEEKARLERLANAKKTFRIYHDEHPTDTVSRYKANIKNPKTAIRAFCVECCGGLLADVANCTAPKCALYPFRMGQNPFHAKVVQRLAGEAVLGDDDGSADE